MYIRGNLQTNLFKLTRKLERTKNKSVGLRIDSIEPAGKGFATCISVTGEKLFVTSNFIVTHNTFASLLHHMKYIHLPYYKGVTIRRTTPMLRKPGAIWDEAKSLYRDVDPNARIRDKEMKITFGPVKDPTKRAEVTFTHFERVDDTDNFQGSQLSSAVLDELCQFEESQFLYIMSRLRTKADMKPVMRATMNPASDTWVRKYVDYYLYPEGHDLFGRPDPSKQGKVRWFIRQDGDQIIWRDSRQELFEEYGVKDDEGNLFPDDHPRQIKPLSFSFISASVYDNPFVAPSYIAFLEGLNRVEKELLLYGNWEARPANTTYFQRDWCEEVTEYDSSQIDKLVRAYDFAGSLKSDANPSPDYTASTLMARMKDGTYYILDAKRTRIRYGDWEKFILDNAMEDKDLHKHVDILIPSDPNPAAKAACEMLIRSLAEKGLYAQKIRASTSKLDRFRPFSAMCQNSGVKFLKGCATDLENKVYNDNNFLYKELENFNGMRKRGESGHDDLVDSISDCFSYLASKVAIPNFLGGLKSFGQGFSGGVASNFRV